MTAVLTRALTYLTVPVRTAVVTVAAAAAVLAGPAPLAVTGGLLLGFVLPGLALTAIVFRHRTLSAVERTVLVPALSLAVPVVSGLVLYVADFRLDRTSWTLAAAGATLLALGLAAVPERVWQGEEPEYEYVDEDVAEGQPEVAAGTAPGPPPGTAGAPADLVAEVGDDGGEVGQPVPPGPFAPWSAGQTVQRRRLARALLPMILVLAVLAGAGYLSYVSSSAGYDVTVTALSAAPPGPVDAAGDRVVALTATGLVAADAPYTVAVTDRAGTRIVEQTVTPDGDGAWTGRLRLPADERLTVGLFRAGDATAYRTLIVAAVQ